MPKPKKAGGRVVKMSPLTIARIEAELLVLAAELKARVPDLTPAKLQALRKRLRRAKRRQPPQRPLLELRPPRPRRQLPKAICRSLK